MNNISKDSFNSAINHIVRFGDTDIFPHLIELRFLAEKRVEISDKLSQYNVSNYQPSHSIEALAPKSRFGFRIANQLLLADCLVFTAAVIEIADDLEKIKTPKDQFGPYAYRFKNKGDGSLFEDGRTYRDWLAYQRVLIEKEDFESVIFTDIADFYQRIYFHRIENVLRSSTANKHCVFLIEKIIKKIRAKQSYGIPVGGSASRLIAEAVLSDFDHGLASEEFNMTRFVDDIRIYVPKGQDPYKPLCLTAEMLLSEGLTLNAQKTRLLTRAEYSEYLADESSDMFDESQKAALEALFSTMYFEEEEEPDPDALAALQSLNLNEILDGELDKDHWDFGRIRAVLRAMRLTETENCVPQIVERLPTLLPFIKDIILLFDALKRAEKLENFNITEKIIELLNSGAGTTVPAIRAWLLEIFIREISPISSAKLNAIPRISEIDGRQIILANGVIENIVYFRKNKTRFENYSKYEQYALVLGATCLPKDEYEVWLGAVQSSMKDVIDPEFCDWAMTKQGALKAIIADNASIHGDV